MDSPAVQVSAGVTISDYADPVSLRAFAAAVDVISFEFENVSAEGLELLASLKPVRPSPDTTLSTPAGSRSAMSSATTMMPTGVCSAGLSTTQLPAARAGASF